MDTSPKMNNRRSKMRAHSTDVDHPRGLHNTHDGGLRKFMVSGDGSPIKEAARRINDATSDKELFKAMSTYLNKAGAADYNLPKMTGERIMDSNKTNFPSFGFKEKTKLSWFPGRDVDFKGSSSPPATNYSPDQDRPYPKLKYSVGHQKRFVIPSSVNKLHKQIPHQYETLEPGLVTGNIRGYDFNRVAMGYGTKSDFTNSKELSQIPGSKYNSHIKNSLSYQSKKNNPKTQYGFYNKYDKWEKTCYKGMEHHFYMRETKGPGAYLKQDFVHLSPTAKASQFSIPKTDRGLLSFSQKKQPGPGYYENDVQAIKSRIKDATFAMPRASRDVSFSKYGSEHQALVKKGLF